MNTHYVFRLGCIAFVLMTLDACMATPRNNQQLSSPGGSFQWSGWVVNPNEVITLKVKDQSDGSWDTRWTATTNTTGQSDGQLTWYSFSTNTTTIRYSPALSSRKYWRTIPKVGTQRRIAADLLSTSPTRGDLVTFDADADTCINAQSTGMAIANNCRSSASPVATVTANCGKTDQACCLANDVASRFFCDGGHRCGPSNTCSVPAGALHQACYADGSCNDSSMQCVDDVCQDMIQRAPVMSSKLVVHTCNASGAGTREELWVRLRDEKFYLDHPGTDAAQNATDSWGLAVPDINNISDINKLTIGTEGPDSWCVDRVDLFINGAQVFTKSFSGGIWILGADGVLWIDVADQTTIRNAIDAADRLKVCSIPSSFDYADLQSMIAGKIGDVFARSRLELTSDDRKFDGSWGSYGVTVSRVDASTIRAAVKFRATAELDDLPDFDITGNIEVTASASCSVVTSGTGSPNRFDYCDPTFNASVRVTKAVGTPDTGVPFVQDLVTWIANVKIASAAQTAVSNFPDVQQYFDLAQTMMCSVNVNNQSCDPNGNVCTCPNINAGTSSLSYSWTAMSSPPFVLCLF